MLVNRKYLLLTSIIYHGRQRALQFPSKNCPNPRYTLKHEKPSAPPYQAEMTSLLHF